MVLDPSPPPLPNKQTGTCIRDCTRYTNDMTWHDDFWHNRLSNTDVPNFPRQETWEPYQLVPKLSDNLSGPSDCATAPVGSYTAVALPSPFCDASRDVSSPSRLLDAISSSLFLASTRAFFCPTLLICQTLFSTHSDHAGKAEIPWRHATTLSSHFAAIGLSCSRLFTDGDSHWGGNRHSSCRIGITPHGLQNVQHNIPFRLKVLIFEIWHPSFRMEQFISTSKLSIMRSRSVLVRLISTVQAWQNVEIRKNVETSLISKHNIFLKWDFSLFQGLISDWERRRQMIWHVQPKKRKICSNLCYIKLCEWRAAAR